MNKDVAALSRQQIYQLFTAAIQPRPIAWISTANLTGTTNLAPFSFFTVASLAPPVLCVTITGQSSGLDKDTLRNLKDCRECVINIVTATNVEVANLSCGNYPPDVSEIDALGIPTVDSTVCSAPGIASSPVRFECRLREIKAFGEGDSGTQMVFLDVLHLHVDDNLLDQHGIDPSRLSSIGKLGRDGYTRTCDRFDLIRPTLG